MTDYETTSYKMGRDCISRITTERSNDRIWYAGVVITPHGIVDVVHSEPPRGSWQGHTVMELGFEGRMYRREWRKCYQPRYLVNLARKFAEDIAS